MKIVRMSVAGIVMAGLINGCAASATQKPLPVQPVSPASVVERQDDFQSSREKDMVLLFQSLLQMNKRENLKISAAQAESLLPLIKRNSSVGELETSDQKVITALLTEDQKRYVDEFLEETRLRKEQFKELKEQQGISEEERERMIREFLSKRAQERDGQPPPHHNREDGGAPALPGAGAGPVPAGPGGKNIEQQLIDLLEAKLRSRGGGK
ncbi:hypothetical protein [Paenibacillus piri]|uniref:Uncharacterized protein n=1 Tax=Paenibacillus piri TaxID=2547395 RepID=A0A4R5KUX8_9BACL|nr:hypothetical protein [Paenibacillus piri]TDF99536.1 hypothetical protein E1757_06740 [Paenibacillus piri]